MGRGGPDASWALRPCIADWLACSARQVKRLRADLSTRVMAAWIDCDAERDAAVRAMSGA